MGQLQETEIIQYSHFNHKPGHRQTAKGLMVPALNVNLLAIEDIKSQTTIKRFAESQLLAGKYDDLLKFIATIPQIIIDQHPIILVYQATAMLFSECPSQSIENVLSKVKKMQNTSNLAGEIAAIQAIIQSYSGKPDKGVELLKNALTMIDQNNIFFRNIIERNLGIAYTLKNDLRNANTWFEHLLLSSYALNDMGGSLASYNYLTYIRKVQGRLNDAGVIYKKALSFIEQNNLYHHPYSIKIIAGYGHLLLYWHRVDEAKDFLERAIDLAGKTEILYAHTAYHHLCESFIRQNDIESATDSIQKFRHLSEGKDEFYGYIHTQQTLAVQARIDLEAGRIDSAYAWLLSSGFDQLATESLQKQYGYALGYILPIAARIYIRKGMSDQAIQLLNSIIPIFLQQGATSFLVRALNALAIAYFEQGRIKKALCTLQKSIGLAVAENNFGDFIMMGDQLIPLLNKTMEMEGDPVFISKVIKVLSNYQPSHKAAKNKVIDTDSLSQREMDVLILIAKGMSNQEIASSLFLSPNTIKSHSIKIYRKLEVNNRHQAVSKGRLIGILPAAKPSIRTPGYKYIAK